MAKKRINQKLVMILLLVGIPMLLFLGVAADSRWPWLPDFVHKVIGRDPVALYERGIENVKKAKDIVAANEKQVSQIENPSEAYIRLEELNEEQAKPVWAQAVNDFNKAYKFSQGNDELTIDILWAMADMNWSRKEYGRSMWAWKQILERDPQNYEAKKKSADFMYEVAKTNQSASIWSDVYKNGQELVAIDAKNPYGYELLAYSSVRLVTLGGTEKPQKYRNDGLEAIDTLLQLDKTNVVAYQLQADMYLFDRRNSDDPAEKERLKASAEKSLMQAILENPESTEAKENYFRIILYGEVQEAADVVLSEGTLEGQKAKRNLYDDAVAKAVQVVDQWIANAPDKSVYYVLKTQLKIGDVRTLEEIDELIGYMDKAIQDKVAEPEWYATLGRLLVKRATYSETPKDDLLKAYAVLHESLYLSESLDTESPTQGIVRFIRYHQQVPYFIDVCTQLAKLDGSSSNPEYLENAKLFLKELSEKVGEESVLALHAEGQVAIADGRIDEGINKFYEAEQQVEVLDVKSAFRSRLQWDLFQALKDAGYDNLAVQYAASVTARRSPKDQLEFMKVFQRLPGRNYDLALMVLIESYENRYGDPMPYEQDVLMIKGKTLLTLGRRDEAKDVIKKLQGDNYKVRMLKSQILDSEEERARALAKLLDEKPDDEVIIDGLLEYYLVKGNDDSTYFDQARAVLKNALKVQPDNLTFKRRLALMMEPNPNDIAQERAEEIVFNVYNSIEDPYTKAMELGDYYTTLAQKYASQGEEDVAQANYEKAKESYDQALTVNEDDLEAITNEVLVCLQLEDWATAESLVIRLHSLDENEAIFYEARLNVAREEWGTAAALLETYLKNNPISIEAHLGLSQAYLNLDRIDDALDQADQAASLDNINVVANRQYVMILNSIFQERGVENVSDDEITVMRVAILRILEVRPMDVMANRLKVTYNSVWMGRLAQRMNRAGTSNAAKEELRKSIDQLHQNIVATCQALIELDSTNAMYRLLLANEYYQYSTMVDSAAQADAQKLADETFKSAKADFPDSADIVTAYGMFLRETGQKGEDEKMLQDMIASSTGKTKNDAIKRLSGLYIQKGNIQQAETLLTTLLEADSSDLQGGLMLIEVYARLDQFEKALEWVQHFRQIEDSERLLTREVELTLQAGQIEKADSLLKEMQETYPDKVSSILLAAQFANRNAQYDEAIKLADQAIAKDPGNTLAYLFRAQAYYYKDNLTEAVETLKRLQAIGPEGQRLAQNLLAQVYWRQTYYDDAINELRIAIQQDRANERTKMMYITMLQNRQRWDDINRYYQEEINAQPDNTMIYMQAAQMAIAGGDYYKSRSRQTEAMRNYNRAIETLNKAITLAQESGEDITGLLSTMLTVLLRTEQYEQAIAFADGGLKAVGNNPTLLLQKAEALHKMGKTQDAIAIFATVIDAAKATPNLVGIILGNISRIADATSLSAWANTLPDSAAKNLILAGAYQMSGQIEASIDKLESAKSQLSSQQQLMVDQQLLTMYLQNQRWAEAIEINRQLVQRWPDNAGLNNNLAYALLQSGEHDEEAVTVAKKAYNLYPIDTDIMDTYAMALIRTKEFAQAAKIMQQAIAEVQRVKNLTPPEYEYHLAEALIGLGQSDQAKDRLNKAYQAIKDQDDPNSKRWQEKISSLLKEL